MLFAEQELHLLTSPKAQGAAKKLEKLQANIHRKTQEYGRQEALSREQSSYHLHPPSRTTSQLRLGPVTAESSVGAGAMSQAVSRNSSFRSIKPARAELAVAGASVGVPELSHVPQLGSSAPTRSQTPVGVRPSNDLCPGGFSRVTDGGAAAGPVASARTTREHIHGSLQQQWSYRDHHLLGANSEDVGLLHQGAAAGSSRGQSAGLLRAATAGELTDHVVPALLQQTPSAPMVAHSQVLQHQLSQTHVGAGVHNSTHLGVVAAIATSGGGGHPLLVGELSLEHPLPSTGGTCSEAAAGHTADQTAVGDGAAAPSNPAAAEPAPQPHLHPAFHAPSPLTIPIDVLVAASPATPVGSEDSQLHHEVRGPSASMPASPVPVLGCGAPGQHSASVVAVPSKLRPVATGIPADSRPQSRSAGGVMGGVVGVSDSYDSDASSYAARRQVVSFRPYPPDSPKAHERRRQQLLDQGGVECVHAGQPVHSAPIRSSPSPAAARSISRLLGSGSTGGVYQVALHEAGRSRSGRLTHGDWASSPHQADHLSVLIPPSQQMPISRVNTPCGSGGGCGGSAGSYGGSGGGLAPVIMPQAPWGLPPDAAFLAHGHRAVGSSGAAPHHGGRRHRVSAGLTNVNRWSVPGVPAECSAGNLSNIVASPLSSNQTDGGLIPAVGVKDVTEGMSRACSAPAGEAVAVDIKSVAALVPVADVAARATKRGWALVRDALRDGRLMALLQDEDNYSVVTATFKRLFPRDFDKAIPVFNHRKVDGLLMQWEAAAAQLERAQLKQLRTGRPPTRFQGRIGQLFSCLSTAGCGCKSCKSRTELCGGCLNSHVVEIIPEIQVRWCARRLQVLTCCCGYQLYNCSMHTQ